MNLGLLHLRNNELIALPPEIGNLVNLRSLHLENNKLIALPPEIGNLVNLRLLTLASNQITALPAEIGNLVNLKSLDLSRNQITALPDEIGNLVNLQALNLFYNKLIALPAEIGNLVNLQHLNLARNQITALPAEIGNFVNLQVLELFSNQITAIPLGVVTLANLQRLTIEDNPCLFMLNKTLANFRSTGINLDEIREEYANCTNYKCKTALARLCQSICCGGEDANALNENLNKLSDQLRHKIIDKVQTLYLALPENSEAPNQELLAVKALHIVLLKKRELLVQALVEVLKEEFRTSLFLGKRDEIYWHVRNLSGQPTSGDDNWGENHATDNIILLIDALAITIGEKIL